MSQARRVPSREADSSQRPSSLSCMSVMRSLWPRNCRTLLTASTSYLFDTLHAVPLSVNNRASRLVESLAGNEFRKQAAPKERRKASDMLHLVIPTSFCEPLHASILEIASCKATLNDSHHIGMLKRGNQQPPLQRPGTKLMCSYHTCTGTSPNETEGCSHADDEVITSDAEQGAAGVVTHARQGAADIYLMAQLSVLEAPDAQAAVQPSAHQQLVAGVRGYPHYCAVMSIVPGRPAEEQSFCKEEKSERP